MSNLSENAAKVLDLISSMTILEAADLVTIDGAIKLTEAGNTLAEKVVRRHRLAERFLRFGGETVQLHDDNSAQTPPVES